MFYSLQIVLILLFVIANDAKDIEITAGFDDTEDLEFIGLRQLTAFKSNGNAGFSKELTAFGKLKLDLTDYNVKINIGIKYKLNAILKTSYYNG
jgi:hypothetical protein